MRSLTDELRNARQCETQLYEVLCEEFMGSGISGNNSSSTTATRLNRNKRPRVSAGMQSIHRFLTSNLHADKLALAQTDLHLALTTQIRFYYDTYKQYVWSFCPLDPAIFDEQSMNYYLSRAPEEACPMSLSSTIAVCMGIPLNLFIFFSQMFNIRFNQVRR